MQGGERVDRVRKLFHEEMSPKAAARWTELQRTHAYWATSQLLKMSKEGEVVSETIERCVA